MDASECLPDRWGEAVKEANRRFLDAYSRGPFLVYPCNHVKCPGTVLGGCRFSRCVARYPGQEEFELLR